MSGMVKSASLSKNNNASWLLKAMGILDFLVVDIWGFRA